MIYLFWSTYTSDTEELLLVRRMFAMSAIVSKLYIQCK